MVQTQGCARQYAGTVRTLAATGTIAGYRGRMLWEKPSIKVPCGGAIGRAKRRVTYRAILSTSITHLD
jgi:hypothetical protein